MIKYIGSKRRLVPLITAVIDAVPGVRRVLDLFSGTSRVGWALKNRGYEVVANDHNTYAHVLARCYVQADADQVLEAATRHIGELARVPPHDGWFTETFCRKSRFFHPSNGARIEAQRNAIADWSLEPDLEAVVLVALMEAADRVDSTTGVQMAYLKQWAPRALGALRLRVPAVLPGPGQALMTEAWEAASQVEADLVYIDPPYNQHSYRSNYHVWETLIRWDEPDTYGVACKRVDCRTHKSPFNSKPGIRPALERVLDATGARTVLLSFSDDGYIGRADLEAILRRKGHVGSLAIDHPRYVGARIGIYNPKGEKVGRVGRLRNREVLYVVSQDPAALKALEGADLGPLAVA